MQRRLAEYFGWYGMAAIVLAYALVSFKLIAPHGYAYQLLNLTGAIGLVVVSAIKKASQPMVLNIFWAAIALVAILQLLFS